MDYKESACCDEVSSLIIEYIDGELDSETAKLAARHIKECSDCKKLYRDMSEVCRAAAETAYDAPAELHCRVMSAIRAERRRRKIKRFTMFAGVGAAAMLTLSVGITLLLGSFGFFDGLTAEKHADNVYYSAELSSLDENAEYFIFSNSGSELNSLYRSNVAAYDCLQAQDSDKEFLQDCNEETSPASAPAETRADISEVTEYLKEDILEYPQPTSSRTACLAGEWTLGSGDAKLTLHLLNITDFLLTDTAGNDISGRYEVSEGRITFIFDGGRAEYAFFVTASELELSYTGGEKLIGDK